MTGTHPTLDALREATGSAHRILDSALRIAVPTPTEGDVATYLAALLAFVEPLEARLWALPELAHLEPVVRASKGAWLRADLATLGVSPPSPDTPPPVIPDPVHPAALGIAYVLEGSTLGGRVLARRPHLARFRTFQGYGSDTGRLWQELVIDLESAGGHPAARSTIVRSARETFESLTAWFDSRGALHRSPATAERVR